MVARLALAAHVLTIERRSNGHWSDLGSGGRVFPEEAVRYSGRFGFQLPRAGVEFRVLNERTGENVWNAPAVRANFAGNAWVDATAPRDGGDYTLIGDSKKYLPGSFGKIVTGGHESRRSFTVAVDAPAPPRGDGGSWPPDWLKNPMGNAWVWVLVLGGILVLSVAI